MRGRLAFLAATPALALLFHAVAAFGADALVRRGFLGAVTIERGGAVVVSAVLPDSPAERAGIVAGDTIIDVNGSDVTTVRAFLAKMRMPGGTLVGLGVAHAGRVSYKRIVLPEYPRENDPEVDTTYGSIAIDGTLRRTLETVPHDATGRHPGVFFAGGIGCFSVDTVAPDAYRNLAHDLSRRGFVTLRLEKSGVGDSQGPPCAGVDFSTEAHSYAVALDAFRNDPAVDPAHVYVFGHSIGSIIAPRLGLEQPLAGIIVAEAVARDWFDYELRNERRQLLLSATPPDQIETTMRSKELCSHELMVEKLPEEAIVRAHPDCAQRFSVYPVSGEYIQQVAALNLADPWKQLAVPVLVVYGSSDFVVDEDDHRYIERTVNAAHPGNAELDVINGMDHNLTMAASQQASFDRAGSGKRGDYDPELSLSILRWLCAREHCS